jgi:hypothetical protein
VETLAPNRDLNGERRLLAYIEVAFPLAQETPDEDAAPSYLCGPLFDLYCFGLDATGSGAGRSDQGMAQGAPSAEASQRRRGYI